MKKKNNKHTFFNDFDDFKDYDDYDEYADYSDDSSDDEKFHNYATTQDFSDVSYDDFNKVIEVEDDYDDESLVEEFDDDYDDEDDDREVRVVRKSSTKVEDGDLLNAQLLVLLNNFWLIFKVVGVSIALILLVYFLIEGRFQDLLAYLLLLAGSFTFGFVFMFFVNKLMES